MSIKGVSDVIRLPRKGILRIGEKDPSRNGAPKALDYFVGSDDVIKFYGAEPRELPILFPFNSVEENYDESLKAYKTGGKLFCRGNGEHAWRSDGKGGILEMDCPFQECEYFKKKECKAVGVLTFLIPEISVTGAYQIWTSSRSSMDNMRSTLTQMQRMFGKLSGIPMVLKVVKQKAHPFIKDKKTGEIKQMTIEVPIIHIECTLPLKSIQRLASKKNMSLLEAENSLNPDDFPDTLYKEGELVKAEEVKNTDPIPQQETVINPIVQKFLDYDAYMFSNHGVDSLKVYMTAIDNVTKQKRAPTIEQVTKWSTDKEIVFLSKILVKMESDYPELKELKSA